MGCMVSETPQMATVSSEDIESVRGAMMTLEPLSTETANIWNLIVKVSLTPKRGLTALEFFKYAHPEEKIPEPENLLQDRVRNRVKDLNQRLMPLLGYGYKVKLT